MDNKFLKKFLKGSAAATLGTAASMLFHFISIMFLTRQLNKEEFGIYVLLLLVISLFNVLSGLGLDMTLVKFISSENKEEKNSVFYPVLFMRGVQLVFMSILFYAAGEYLLPLFDPKLQQFALLIPILFILTSLRDLFFNLLQGLNLYKKFASIQTSSAAWRVVLILLFMWFNIFSLENLIYIEIFTTGLAVILQISAVPFKELLKIRPPAVKYKELLKFSIPLYFNVMLGYVFDRINLFIIAAYLTPVSVAYYDVAKKVPDALKRLFQSFIVVYYPSLAKLFSRDDKSAAVELMNNSLTIFSLALSFVAAVSFLFQEEITLLLFSEAYLESSFAFALFSLVFYFRSLSNIIGYSLVSAGYSAAPMNVNIISSIVSVGGSFLLIPSLGFIGGVYSLLMMNVISQISYNIYLAKKNIPSDVMRYAKPFMIFAAVIGTYYLTGAEGIIIKLLFLLTFLALSILLIEESRKYISFALKLIPRFRNSLSRSR